MVHHANKQGLQRGSSRREDILDLVMAMRRPRGWQPATVPSFEIHFEKARSLHGAAIQPMRVGLEQGPDGLAWRHQPIDESLFEQVVALLKSRPQRSLRRRRAQPVAQRCLPAARPRHRARSPE